MITRNAVDGRETLLDSPRKPELSVAIPVMIPGLSPAPHHAHPDGPETIIGTDITTQFIILGNKLSLLTL